MDLTQLLQTDKPLVMGILNVTPDSFSDGGRFSEVGAAVAQATAMLEQGADLIDVGGESTRPGADRISATEQIRRVIPVIERLGKLTHPLIVSIDTTLAPVAAAALDVGAALVNDVSAGREDPELLPLVAERGCHVCLMHMLGEPATMQSSPQYDDVTAEVKAFLLERAAAAESVGIARDRILLDPGIGFGKTTEHNLALLAGLDDLVAAGYPVLLGTSRKSLFKAITGRTDPADRVSGTVATTALAVAAGVRIVRVHDVEPNRQAADVTAAIHRHRSG